MISIASDCDQEKWLTWELFAGNSTYGGSTPSTTTPASATTSSYGGGSASYAGGGANYGGGSSDNYGRKLF